MTFNFTSLEDPDKMIYPIHENSEDCQYRLTSEINFGKDLFSLKTNVDSQQKFAVSIFRVLDTYLMVERDPSVISLVVSSDESKLIQNFSRRNKMRSLKKKLKSYNVKPGFNPMELCKFLWAESKGKYIYQGNNTFTLAGSLQRRFAQLEYETEESLSQNLKRCWKPSIIWVDLTIQTPLICTMEYDNILDCIDRDQILQHVCIYQYENTADKMILLKGERKDKFFLSLSKQGDHMVLLYANNVDILTNPTKYGIQNKIQKKKSRKTFTGISSKAPTKVVTPKIDASRRYVNLEKVTSIRQGVVKKGFTFDFVYKLFKEQVNDVPNKSFLINSIAMKLDDLPESIPKGVPLLRPSVQIKATRDQ